MQSFSSSRPAAAEAIHLSHFEFPGWAEWKKPHTLGGMIPPAPLSPYASSGGMIKVLFPPSCTKSCIHSCACLPTIAITALLSTAGQGMEQQQH